MPQQLIELLICHKNNWVYQRNINDKEKNFLISLIATSEQGLYQKLAELMAQGWQLNNVLESETTVFAKHRIYYLNKVLETAPRETD